MHKTSENDIGTILEGAKSIGGEDFLNTAIAIFLQDLLLEEEVDKSGFDRNDIPRCKSNQF